MRNLLLLIPIIFGSLNLFGQDKVGDLIPLADVPESKALVSHANNYVNAVVSKDYQQVISLTHGDIIDMGGGEEFMMQDLKTQNVNLENQGLKYVSAEVGSHPEFIKAEGEMQCVVPIKYFLDLNSKKVEAWSNLLAVSQDEGLTWKFVNLDKFDDASLRDFVKNISADFVFPR